MEWYPHFSELWWFCIVVVLELLICLSVFYSRRYPFGLLIQTRVGSGANCRKEAQNLLILLILSEITTHLNLSKLVCAFFMLLFWTLNPNRVSLLIHWAKGDDCSQFSCFNFPCFDVCGLMPNARRVRKLLSYEREVPGLGCRYWLFEREKLLFFIYSVHCVPITG